MKGYQVQRRFGWDCHGLPVEFEINKTHKLESRKQILELGVEKYNSLCRSIVTRYSQEWKATVRRTGRWVDMENAYFTMSVDFMQSVWWVFQSLYNKGLIYEGYKVVPYSVGISTVLSNFEANLNYKQVQDPAITLSFLIREKPGVSFLAWTTTPWTLPSNLALAVGKDLDYVEFQEKSSGATYIMAEALIGNFYKDPLHEITLLDRFKGSKLVGLTYQPLFDFFLALRDKKAFQVIHADHVTTESGTGIVHMAPAFGEEDAVACQREGLPMVNPVDDDGMFTSEVPPYAGRRVKEADKDIIAELKRLGRLFKQDTLVHSYPFCWRSDTPLIYRAVSSWFVAVEKIKDQVIAANKTTQWVPDHLRDGRFGNWLESARDWAISRNRFWGTPIPIWKNEEGETLCIGSREELENLSGQKVSDLHMDVIDSITIPSPTGKSPLKRVEGVLDCWFESGSMPYAQWGYPLTHQEDFQKNFPADFIAEGLDQTRGWFYTLMVIGTALFGKAPFRNVLVNGLVLAEDGKKMSKSLRNYPDPNQILEQYGADALRLYMIDSPVVKAQELRFSENGVKDVVRRILLRWWNSYSFFINYANIDQFRPQGDASKSPNLLDQWVLSRLHHLIKTTETEMNGYRLYNVVPGLLGFVEELTNTYIRFNRSHFWRDGMPEDKRYAYETLYEVLITLSKIMAPFAPFLSEVTYQNLVKVLPGGHGKESVHLESFPEFQSTLLRDGLERAVATMDALVMSGRNLREKIGVKAKIPLKELRVIQRDPEVLKTLEKFEPYFRDELNVKKVIYTTDEDQYVQISAKANFPVLGKRVGAKMKTIAAGISRLTLSDFLRLEAGESIEIEGEKIELSDVEIRRAPRGDRPGLATHRLVAIELDTEVSPEQIREGLAREVIRKIQAARKNADLVLDARIQVELSCPKEFAEAVEAHLAYIQSETLSRELRLVDKPQGAHLETVEIDEAKLTLALSVVTS
jgi:isoleucyl-tRNA synthetase